MKAVEKKPANRQSAKVHGLWQALRKARKPLRSAELCVICDLSPPYVRRLLKHWTEAGHTLREDAANAGPGELYAYTMSATAPAEPPILTTDGRQLPREAVVYMTAEEFATIRRLLKLSLGDIGVAIGRMGKRANITAEMHKYEKGALQIREETAKKVRALGREELAKTPAA